MFSSTNRTSVFSRWQAFCLMPLLCLMLFASCKDDYPYDDKEPEWFYRFYREKMICPDAKPNPAHLKLAELEEKGKLTAVITQNIDGLHTAAGSRNVLELHGSVHRNYCQNE